MVVGGGRGVGEGGVVEGEGWFGTTSSTFSIYHVQCKTSCCVCNDKVVYLIFCNYASISISLRPLEN